MAMCCICMIVWMILQVDALQKTRLVYPRLLEERSADGRVVVHVHNNLTLNLREASVAAPRVHVLTEENGKPVTQFYKGEDIDRYIYEDEEKIATVMIEKLQGGLLMRGLIGPRHRIQPMPVTEKSEGTLVPHSIYEIEQEDMLDKTLNDVHTAPEGILSERMHQYRGYLPDIVNVEVFVVSDGRHHRHFQTTGRLLWYLCVLINSANLRYRAASYPKIRLMLTGVEMPKAEPYAVISQQEYLFDEGTIGKFKTYAFRKKNEFGNPDLVYLMTGLDVYTVLNGKASDAGLGIGYVSGVCTDHYVALGEDKPGLFTGVHTFTHEVAHLLGAKHDGDAADKNEVGHPGASGCPWKDGHIMSYINKGPEHHQFSRCSLEQMRFVLRLRGEPCWRYSTSGYAVEDKFPGMMVSFQNFCDNIFNKKEYTFEASHVDPNSCKVRCRYYKYQRYNPYQSGTYKIRYEYKEDALDFMPCAEQKVCIQGKCVQKPGHVTEATRPTESPRTRPPITSRPSRTTGTSTTRCVCDEATPYGGRPTSTTYPPRRRGRFSQWYRTRSQ
uniref:Peptidase M12B domain-containing protein n=1 Tax=Amblyomma maculatum TaxID=34609 RepID=G3MLM1_AMBMU